MSAKLRLQISVGHVLKFYEQERVAPPVDDVERALAEGARAFSAAFNRELEKARRAHARRVMLSPENHEHFHKVSERSLEHGHETTHGL